MQVRINGVVADFNQVKDMMMSHAVTQKERNTASTNFYSLRQRMVKQTRGWVTTQNGDKIIVDKYIGTDMEYAIHEKLQELQLIPVNLKEYLIKEKEVEDLMRKWRNSHD